MKKKEIIKIIRNLEKGYIDYEENDYWQSLSHEIKIDFLLKFISTYFKFCAVYNTHGQPESYNMFKEPQNIKLEDNKWMPIIYKETEIILKLIMNNKLNGESIREELILHTRCPVFDSNFHNELNENSQHVITFLSKSYNIKIIKEQNNEILAKIDNSESLLNRMSYFIFAAYNKIILKKSYSEIAKLYNKKYIEENTDSDSINNMEVKKYTNDIKQLFEDIEKDNMILSSTLKKHFLL